MRKFEVEKFERDGVAFTSFERDGVRFLCTGNPTGEFKFQFIGEVADYYDVVGATSVVSGRGTVAELYEKWLDQTAFVRSLGVTF